MVIKKADLNTNYIATEADEFETERQFNMLKGESCEINQLYFARINLCNITWGDIVLALKHCKKTAVWADWGDWHRHWKARGEVFEKIGDEAVENHRAVTARDALLRAAACYHFAEFMYFADPSIKEETRRRVTSTFLRAVPFMDHGFRRLAIPYGDLELPAYLVTPEGDGPFPTVILNNGMESAKEAELYAFAQAFLKRGLAVLLFDGPGQGELLGRHGMVVEWENVIGSVLDATQALPEVDADRIGMFGVSFGGYLCIRGAAWHQDRVKAAINLSGCYDIDNFPRLRGMVLDDFCYVFQLGPEAMNDLAIASLNLRTTPHLERPLLTIHSKTDSLFPFDTALRVHEWARGEKELIAYDHEWHVCTNHMSEFIPLFCDWMAERL
jgi:dienelactone hydrolase